MTFNQLHFNVIPGFATLARREPDGFASVSGGGDVRVLGS